MSVYKVIELIGTSPTSWEDAAKNALDEAKQSLRHLRIAEVGEMDISLDANGNIEAYRTRLKISLKHEGG